MARCPPVRSLPVPDQAMATQCIVTPTSSLAAVMRDRNVELPWGVLRGVLEQVHGRLLPKV